MIEKKKRMRELHISRGCRQKYDVGRSLFGLTGRVVFADFGAARELARKINGQRDLERFPQRAVRVLLDVIVDDARYALGQVNLLLPADIHERLDRREVPTPQEPLSLGPEIAVERFGDPVDGLVPGEPRGAGVVLAVKTR